MICKLDGVNVFLSDYVHSIRIEVALHRFLCHQCHMQICSNHDMTFFFYFGWLVGLVFMIFFSAPTIYMCWCLGVWFTMLLLHFWCILYHLIYLFHDFWCLEQVWGLLFTFYMFCVSRNNFTKHFQACVEFNRGRYSDSLELYKVCNTAIFFDAWKQLFYFFDKGLNTLLLSVSTLPSSVPPIY